MDGVHWLATYGGCAGGERGPWIIPCWLGILGGQSYARAAARKAHFGGTWERTVRRQTSRLVLEDLTWGLKKVRQMCILVYEGRGSNCQKGELGQRGLSSGMIFESYRGWSRVLTPA